MVGVLLNLLTKWIPGLLPKLITERPDLLIDHALAYAALARREIESIKRHWVCRVVAGVLAIGFALAFVVLSGVAVMLYVATEIQSDATWVLFAVPGVMLVLTLIATAIALSKGKPRTESLSAQVRIDLLAFRAASVARS